MSCAQNSPNQQVSPGDDPGLTCFISYISSIANGAELIRQVDVDDSWRVKPFWGLTCVFWAENGKRKVLGRVKAIKSVALLIFIPGVFETEDFVSCDYVGRLFALSANNPPGFLTAEVLMAITGQRGRPQGSVSARLTFRLGPSDLCP